MGFLGPELPLLEQLGVERDERGNAKAAAYETSVPGIFAAGDVRSGSTKRCAAAVGEGSMAVQFVHEHLAARVG
jgi:thioredoxin reductase (NADPH)